MTKLIIQIPCLNEAATIAHVVRTARESIKRLGIAGEIVVADNGSSDGSQALAQEQGARVVRVVERGYGSALAGGIGPVAQQVDGEAALARRQLA